MALVGVFLHGLALFSDLGLAPSIVQNPRGEEPEFLRTAWTIQVIRGAILWIGALAVSLPAASFYDEPALARFLPVAGFNLFISGLESANLHLLQRHVNVLLQTAFNIGVQIVELLVTTAGALIWRIDIELRNLQWVLDTLIEGQSFPRETTAASQLWGGIWALIIGTLVARIVHMLITHFLPGPRMRFSFHRENVHELVHFGKWIFLAGILTFFVNSFDRPVLAKFMDPAQLGVYSIGRIIPFAVHGVLFGIASRVLFPVYAELARDRPHLLRSRMFRVRLILGIVTLPPLCAMVVFGPEIIGFLYDERYAEAGVFMQLLAVCAIFKTLLTPIASVLLSVGNSYRHFLMMVGESMLLLASMALGGFLYGTYGIIVGVVIAPVLNYPLLAVLTRKYGAWTPLFDVAYLSASAVVVVFGFWIKSLIM